MAVSLLAGAPAAQAYVYWSDVGTSGLFGSGGTTLERGNLDGNGVNPSFVSGASSPGPIVVQGSYVYWANSNGVDAIARASTDGGGVNESFIPGVLAAGLATDGTYLYWTDGGQYVGRATLDGTSVSPHFIDAGASSAPFGIAVVGGKLYLGEQDAIVEVPTSGGSPSPFVSLVDAANFVTSISAANGYLYFAEVNTSSGSIGRVPLSGGPANEGLIPSLQFPTGVTSDGTHLYWVDHGAGSIGKANITSSSATNVQPSFISDSGGPFSVAVDSRVDPTTTSVTCSPSTVATASPSVCTATVADTASSEAPTGSVIFSGGSSTFFPGGNSCTLGPRPGGGVSCTVGAESTAPGAQSVTAAYSGDPTHATSSGGGQFCAGDATSCGGGGTGTASGGGTTGSGGAGAGSSGGITPRVVCKVPKLKGQTLKQARKLLAKAHCRVGKVKTPRLKKGTKPALVVVGQSPAPGTRLSSGARVALRLGIKPRPKPHRR